MKINVTLLALIVLFSCDFEEFDPEIQLSTQPSEDWSEQSVSDSEGISSTEIEGLVFCDVNYIFRPMDPNTPGYFGLSVQFDSTISENERHCIRYNYFTTYEIYMSTLQPVSHNQDLWLYKAIKTGVDVSTSVCEDPRTNELC